MSAAEDAGAVGLSLSAILLPVLVILVLGLVVWCFVSLFRRLGRAVRPKTTTP